METMQTKKWSMYNNWFPNGEETLLYNSASDVAMALLPQIKELTDRYKDNPALLENVHPTLYSFMSEKGFIVDADADETRQLIARWAAEENNPETFSMTINPTLNCNLRCWYCYEEHAAGMDMHPEVVDSIRKLIANKVKEPLLKRLNIGFFGGEPLMKFRDVVLPILTYAKEQCRLFQKKLGVRFTTNGVLLTSKVITELAAFNEDFPVFLQITLDGNREVHDQTRHGKGGGKTYDAIVGHIRHCLKAGMEVGLRFNYTADNIDSFADVLREFEELPSCEKKRIRVDFQQVWQDGGNREAPKKAEIQAEWYKQCGLKTSSGKAITPIHCYADYENCVVINYTGDLYKCTARDFTPQLREGALMPDGTLKWNERYKKRMAIKHGISLCHACRLFPICHGGCSQSKMENDGKETCLYHYSEKEKTDILKWRMEWILTHYDVSY